MSARDNLSAVIYRQRKWFRERWRFRVVAGNGETIAVSEGYVNHADAVSTAQMLLPPGALVYGEELWEDSQHAKTN